MARRSPWAAQTRRERRAAVGGFLYLPRGPKFSSAFEMINRKSAEIPYAEKASFLHANPGSLAAVLKVQSKKVNGANLVSLSNFISKFGLKPEAFEKIKSPVLVDYLTFETAKEIINRGTPLQIKTFKDHFRNYLKERKIPFDVKIFNQATSDYTSTGTNIILSESVDPKAFERRYLTLMKSERKEALLDREMTNKVIRRAFGGHKLTQNQVRVARRWLDTHSSEHGAALLKSIKEAPEDQEVVTEVVQKWRDKMEADLRNALLPVFIVKVSRKAVPSKPKSAAILIKGGTREKRMVDYVGKEEVEQAAKNAREIETKERAAKMVGKKFDVVKYSLDEIARENPAAGVRFHALLASGIIGEGTLRGLYASGSLSRRIFLRAIDELGFTKYFGTKDVNALARFISFIGPKGKRIDKARRMIQSSRGDEIFKFLERNALINTHHGGGDVVYLARAGH